MSRELFMHLSLCIKVPAMGMGRVVARTLRVSRRVANHIVRILYWVFCTPQTWLRFAIPWLCCLLGGQQGDWS